MTQKSYGFYTEGNAAKKIEYETIKKAHAAGKKADQIMSEEMRHRQDAMKQLNR